MGATSLSIDSVGTPHVAYVASGSSGERWVRYATRTNGAWASETVALDNWTGNPTNEGDSVSLELVDDEPVIAYHRRSSRSVELARRVAGSFVSVTLETPPVGFPSDTAGRSLVLQSDCMGRLHIAYGRVFTTDPDNVRLFVARIENNALVDAAAVSGMGSPPFYPAVDSLGFIVGPAGEQTLTARTSTRTTYFATR